MDAIGIAARAIKSGEAALMIAGGVESMSRAPFVMGKAESAYARAAKIEDTTIGWRFVNPVMKGKHGIDSIIYAPDGAKIAHIRILKGAKVVQTINRKISRDGVLEVRMPTTKKSRKALKRGSYRVEIQVGQNLTNLGTKLVRNVSLR